MAGLVNQDRAGCIARRHSTHGQELRTRYFRNPLVRPLGGRWPFCAQRHGRTLYHPAAAAERHRHLAYGPRFPAHADGFADPLPAHEGSRHAVANGLGPRRHRHGNGGFAQPRARGQGRDPRFAGPRGLRREGLGLEAGIGRHYRAPDAPHGHLGRLVAQRIHHGRDAVQGGDRGLCTPARGRADLSRTTSGELGPGAENRDFRSGSGQRGRRRPPVVDPLSVSRGCDLRARRARRGRQ